MGNHCYLAPPNYGAGGGSSGSVDLTSGVTGTLPVTNGGTGFATASQGDLVYGSAANTFSKLAKDANATRYLSNTGSSNNPAWAQVALATGVSGTLPVANGGSGIASYTVGQIVYASGTTALSALDAVATGNALISGGVTTAPSWGKIGLTTHVSGILPTANGGTGIAFFTAAGPTTARVYTFPDAACTILTSNAAVTVAQGGTGIASGTSGGIPYFSGTTTLASSGALAANQLVLGGGAGTTPATLGSLGTTTTVLHGNAGGAPTFGAVVLADTTGIAGSGTNADITSTTALNTITTAAGNTLALTATAPAATTGASQVGKAINATASNAVASTDTNGAAQGGSFTFTTGDAARRSTGNANGGDWNLTVGAGIGTGTRGRWRVTDGTAVGLEFTPGVGLMQTTGGGNCFLLSSGGNLLVIDSSKIGFSTNPSGGTFASSFSNLATGVIGVTSWLQNTGGRKRRAATQTVTDSASLTADDTLSVTLIAGRKYSFRVVYYFTTVATSGVQVDMGGGTCTFTSFQGDVEIANLSTFALSGGGEMTASTTAIGVTALGTSTKVEIQGCFVCNAAGTFIPRFAQNAETVAAESVIAKTNSYMWVEDMP